MEKITYTKFNAYITQDSSLTKKWWFNEQLHRIDGPAVEYATGEKHWYQNGKLHRVDGPAIEDNDGSKHWYQNGKRHRIDGPAIMHDINKINFWYVKGTNITDWIREQSISDKPNLEEQLIISLAWN